MPEPRFQLLAGLSRSQRLRHLGGGSGHQAGETARLMATWRLLGANNREMGRSPMVFDDLDVCRASVEDLKRHVRALTSRIAAGDLRGQWGWSLYLDADEVASSARLFSRLREARVNLDQFLEKVPEASIVQLNTSAAALARRARPLEPRTTRQTKERL